MDAETEYIGELKGLYASLTATQTSDLQWPPPCTHKAFNLAMIKEEKIERGAVKDDFVRLTLTGKFDDILHMKERIELENIFRDLKPNQRKVILMEGAPGCGKSTLANSISQKWGEDKLFTEFKVVVLVRLRDPIVQKARSILDLIPSGKDITVAQKAEESMCASNFQDVLFILDGWDKLPKNLREGSVFHKLVQDDQDGLQNSAVIVTSRPVASGDLHKIVSARIEILGFAPKELEKYFHECLGGDSKAVKTLQEQIEENPEIAGTCYLPLNASILVHLFKNHIHKDLPSSQYGIFSLLVCTCISRHLRERTEYKDISLETLDQILNTEIKEPFQFLCNLAYKGVRNDSITFSSLPENTDTLSILHGVESFVKSTDKIKSFNFIHLSIQELLAAFYIKRLPDDDQVANFNELFDNPRFNAVFQFYSAMTKLQTPGINDILTKVAERCSAPNSDDDAAAKTLLVAILHCLYAAQDSNLCELIIKYLQHGLNLSDTTLNPTDCLSIGYFLSCATNINIGTADFKVRLLNCDIGDQGCKYLVKGLQKCLNKSATKLYMDLKWGNIHEEGSIELSTLLQFDCIDAFNLNGNEELFDQGVLHMADHLKVNTSLTEIQLYTCGLTARGICYIAEALEINNSLKLLNIGGNGIYDAGIERLGGALKVNRHLESLEISSCGMTDKGIQSITDSLQHNECLKELKIHNFQNQKHLNEITDNGDAMNYLANTLKKKSALKSLVLPADFELSIFALQKTINEERELNKLSLIEVTVKGHTLKRIKGISETVRDVVKVETPSNETSQNKEFINGKTDHETCESPVKVKESYELQKSTPFREAEEKAEVNFLHHELLECDHSGLQYNNLDHDISIMFPDGAVSRGDKLYFELGIAMYGPFSFPENNRPISPIIWVCPLKDDYKLQTQFQLKLPHFLSKLTKERLEYHKIQFAKAQHKDVKLKDGQMTYSFQPCEFQPSLDDSNHLVLASRHCCFYCVMAEETHELDKDISYCLVRVEASSNEVIFIAAYLLRTCLQSLEEQFPAEMIVDRKPFKFKESIDDPHLKVVIPRKLRSIVAMEPANSKIRAADIDFREKHYSSYKDMQMRHENKMYPPRVKMRVKMNSSLNIDKMPIKFTGCVSDGDSELNIELLFPFGECTSPLTPKSPGSISLLHADSCILPEMDTQAASLPSAASNAGCGSKKANTKLDKPTMTNLTLIKWKEGESFKRLKVTELICHKWKEIGRYLEIPGSRLQSIEKQYDKDALECISQVLQHWIENQESDYPVSWEGLYELLEDAELKEIANQVKKALDNAT